MAVTPARFGLAMLLPYSPKTMLNTILCPTVTPAAAGAEDVHVVPSLVSTLPEVPGEVKPVPPLPAGSVPEAVDTFTGGRMLERVVMLLSG